MTCPCIACCPQNRSRVTTGRLCSRHPHTSNYPKSDREPCIGCTDISEQGGGIWHSGEPHYVGCPTELAELRLALVATRAEAKHLRSQLDRADGTWARLRGNLALYAFKSLEEVYQYVNSDKAYAPEDTNG